MIIGCFSTWPTRLWLVLQDKVPVDAIHRKKDETAKAGILLYTKGGFTVFKYINQYMLNKQRENIISEVCYQQAKLQKDMPRDKLFRYMLERLETDLRFFENLQLKVENEEEKSFIASIVICGQIALRSINRRFSGGRC